MNAPAEIPGFYYDPEKKKYFRLLPHHAAPTRAFYSSSSVQQLEREKRKAEQERAEAARLKKRKRGSPLTRSPYVKSRLFRELGDRRSDPEEDVKEIYALGLRAQRVFEVEPGKKVSAFALREADGLKQLYIATTGGDVRCIPLCTTSAGSLAPIYEDIRTLLYSHTAVTTLSLSPTGILLATSLNGTAHLLPASAPQQTFRNLSPSIWTSSSGPSGFLLGTSTSALHLSHTFSSSHTHFRTFSDVFATEFHASDGHAFFAGCRDGGVRLFDIRCASPMPRASILLRHGSTITHIRPLADGVNIIVNGLQGCALYDLRFPHPGSPSARFAEATRPALVFDGLRREDGYMLDLGFDVCRERGVMAVADQENRVRLWSVRTGKRLRSGEVDGRRWEWVCKGLKFDHEGGLWASDGGAVDMFGL